MAHPSVAFAEFEATVESAERLAVLEREYDEPPPASDALTVQALRGGFCVLLVGGFEQFLKEAFAEHLEELIRNPLPVAFAQLPAKLQVSSAFDSLGQAMRGPRHGPPTERIDRLPAIIAAASRLVTGMIDPQALAQTKANPSSVTVRDRFRAIGAGNPFESERAVFDVAWGKVESTTFVSDKLDETVNARHVVAHTANALGVTRDNLTEWPRFLRVWTRVLDRRLDAYVAELTS